MTAIITKFIKFFIIKYFGTQAIEQIVIILLGALVKRTDSKIDDKIYHAVFHKTKEYEECKECGNGD